MEDKTTDETTAGLVAEVTPLKRKPLKKKRLAVASKPEQTEAPAKAGMMPPPHGTRARYGWKLGRCRCDKCKAANTAWQQEYRKAKRAGQSRERKAALHGTRAKYVGGCRCEECTRANRDYQRDKARQYRTATEQAR